MELKNSTEQVLLRGRERMRAGVGGRNDPNNVYTCE
jgi:hypothetical protein